MGCSAQQKTSDWVQMATNDFHKSSPPKRGVACWLGSLAGGWEGGSNLEGCMRGRD